MTNPYRTLGVKPTATIEEITKAYRRKAKQLHPDTNPGDEKARQKYLEVDEAYRVLSDPDLRAEYDRTGKAPSRKGTPVDKEHAELAAILQPILLEVLHNADSLMGGVRTCRVVDRIRERLNQMIQSAERHRTAVEKGITNLKHISGRFKVKDDKPNVLEDIVRAQLSGVEAELARTVTELDKLTRVKAYLANVSYDFGSDGFVSSSRMISDGL